MTRINVSEFKAVCLRVMEEVRQTGEPVEVLKNGKPLVVVYPAPGASRKAAFGAMRPSLTGPAGDLVSPLDESEWAALRDQNSQ